MFVHDYLLPLQRQKKGGSVEITAPGFRTEHLPHMLLGVKPPDANPMVADPTPYLNHMLYTVEQLGHANLSIPYEVVLGFSNIGFGFYPTFRYWRDKATLLSNDIDYPLTLIVETANGELRCMRRPDDSKEQLFHFLYCLRATMWYLAEHPIGKRTTQSIADIAQMLTMLPKRAAFVRSGDNVGVIYTDDNPQPVERSVLHQRLQAIQARTRAQYCTPKEQLEATPTQPPEQVEPTEPSHEPEPSGWEEVEE